MTVVDVSQRLLFHYVTQNRTFRTFFLEPFQIRSLLAACAYAFFAPPPPTGQDLMNKFDPVLV